MVHRHNDGAGPERCNAYGCPAADGRMLEVIIELLAFHLEIVREGRGIPIANQARL